MYIRVLCTIIYQSDDLALSASDTLQPHFSETSCCDASTTSRTSFLGNDVEKVLGNDIAVRQEAIQRPLWSIAAYSIHDTRVHCDGSLSGGRLVPGPLHCILLA